MRFRLLLAACVLLAACDIQINPGAAPVSPTSPGGVTVTNTNTNTNTSSSDRSDTGPASNSGGTGDPTAPAAGVLPLPAYGESVVLAYGAAHPDLVLHSCQLTDGEAAWRFLDQVIARLKARDNDLRWGYLCKDASCSLVARDVVAYRAGSSDSGIWIVDVLGNHCPGPTDSPTMVRWGVLPFETVRRWIGVRP